MKKNWWRILTLATLTGITLTVFITYFWTYDNPLGQTTITVNTYSERLVEHIIIGLAVVGGMIMAIQLTIKIARGKE
mgnify:CR=1 FL=1